jgi:hypothetical protein
MSSKMDRYFEPTYDPRLDVAALPAPPVVPATGLLDDADYAGWDAMLALIRTRRLERAAGAGKAAPAAPEPGVMDIQYSKRGAVREWDMGKDGMA